MNTENLFEAVGLMEEKFLEECLTVQEGRSGRIMWKTVLAAAILASLTISAAAAVITGLYGRIVAKQEETVRRLGTDRIESLSNSLDVYLSLPEVEAAPEEIRDYYAPTIYGLDTFFHCSTNEGEPVRRFEIVWDLRELGMDSDGWISFQQWCAQGYGPEEPVDSLQGLAFTEPEHLSEVIRHNGRELFSLRVDTYENAGNVLDNASFLYWTDGSYIFRLNFPNSMERDDALEIVDSVELIADMEHWLERGKEKIEESTVKRWEFYVQELSSGEAYPAIKSFVSADTEVLEDGDLKVLIQMLPVKDDAPFQERLVYPRIFEYQKMENLMITTSDADPETEGYELVEYIASWKAGEYGENEEIRYQQKWRRNSPIFSSASYAFFIFDAEEPEQVQTRTLRWDGNAVFEVGFEKGKGGVPGAKYYFWGDAYNTYSLRVPYVMEEAMVKEILDSIR